MDENHKKSTVNKTISYERLRQLVRTYKYEEEPYLENIKIMKFVKDENVNSFPCPYYWSDIHNRIPRGAIKSFTGNINSALSNKKNGNISSFNLKYKTKKDKRYTILFEDDGYPKELKKLQGIYRMGRKIFKLEDILQRTPVKNLIISYERDTGKYYLYLPVDYNWQPIKIENQDGNREPKYNYISLDTGIRTFQTGYSEDHTVEIGKESELLSKILFEIDSIEKRISNQKRNRKRKRLKKQKVKKYHRLKCLIDDIHWKTICFLTGNYKRILLPDFRITGMVKKQSSKLPKIVKRLMYIYSFFRFKERLQYKCKVKNIKLHIVDESYTSKTCGSCGKLNNSLGSNKRFICPYCSTRIDRDINGARNILIKNWSTLQDH